MAEGTPAARAPWRAPPLIYLLLLMMVLAFPGLDLWEEGTARLIRAGALYGPLVRSGDGWRLLSYGFLHGGAAHLISNGFALYSMGPQLEQVYGRARGLCLFFLPVIAGGLLSTLLKRDGVAVGASAGAFGFLGAQIVLGLRLWHRMTFAGQRAFVRSTGVVVLLNGGLALLVHNIDHAAHAGGFLCGLLLAAPWRLLPEEGLPKARPASALWWLPVALCLGGLIFGGVAVARLQRGPWAYGLQDYQGAGLRVRAVRGLVPEINAEVLRLRFPGMVLAITRHRGATGELGEEAARALLESGRAGLREAQELVFSADATGTPWLLLRAELAQGERAQIYARAAGADVLEVALISDPAAAQDLALPAEVWPLLQRVDRVE